MIQSKHFTFPRTDDSGKQFESELNEWLTAHPNLTRIIRVIKVPSVNNHIFVVIYEEVEHT